MDTGQSDRFAKHATRIVMTAAAVCLAWFLFNLLLFEYGRDQGIFAVVAETILRGGAPYRDAWDFKPPMIYFVYAAARFVFGSSTAAIRVVEAVALLSLVPAFATLSRRFLGDWRAGVAAATVALSVTFVVSVGDWLRVL